MKRTLLLLLLLTVAFSSCKKDDPVIAEYIVTFNTQGGSSIDALKVPEGGKVTKPQDPTKENYIFSGWYKEAACTTVWDFEKETVMSNVTLYAKWVEVAQACTVTFDSQGGSEVASLTVNKGEKLAKPTDPTRTDYSFLGWYKDAACTSPWEFASDVVNDDITLYARWSEPGEMVYKVSFDTDGGSKIEVVSVKKNEKLMQPANPTKAGYEFEGWFTDPERLTPYDFEAPVTADITLYGKWTKAVFALVDFEAGADFEANGILWDEATRTLDITNATAGSVLEFNAKGVAAVKTSATAFFNKNASSIGGETSLSNILKVGSLADGKIALKVNIPVQTLKVPLDIVLGIQSFDSESESETITITSRPDYNGTGIQPVMMKTTDDKLVFWAPINAGATVMPESAPTTPDTDITESCGKLFQWGRKFGFAATNNSTTTEAEKFDGKTDPLGFPKGKGALANMNPWDGKFIIESRSNPNTQYNWLLLNEDGSDNPTYADMVDGEWYQQLWNKGTEDAPVKTEYDPCPEGWRVPTITEWRAIGAENASVTVEYDRTNRLLSIAGAESGQKFILPAVGHRTFYGTSKFQGSSGNYWSSSIQSGAINARNVYFNGPALNANFRAYGFSVRCVQE